MGKQLLFKSKYTATLKEQVSLDESLDKYKSKDFIYDKKQVLMMPNIEESMNLADKLDASNDFKTAIQLYEAFKDLEPIQASDERFWTYLAHVDLYPYMIKRWPGVKSGEASDPRKYILDHWFLSSSAQSSLLRHALAGLWWAVYMSVDESRRESRYELTKILFRQLDFPTRTLGTYKLGRHKEAVLGILEFINENENLFKTKFQSKARFVTEYLNIVGGIKPIAYYDRNFFKSELEKVIENISKL